MFQKERFIEECRAALKETDSRSAIRELVAKAVAEPAEVLRGLGEPQRAGVETIYRADDLTTGSDHRSDSRLRRRFFCDASQRMGSCIARGAPL